MSPTTHRLTISSLSSRLISHTALRRAPALETNATVGSTPVGIPPDYSYLKALVKSTPVVLDLPTPNKAEKYFNLPLGTHFKAPSREMGLQMKNLFAHALREHGIVAIELGFDDGASQFTLQLIDALGCAPDTHSSTQGALWDVTYKPEGVVSAKSGGRAHSHSHGVGEFAWHTDGAFEETPQRFFALHIVHPDKLGGGIFRVLPAEDLVTSLKPSSVETLLNTELDLQVPDEFYKGKASIKGKLLSIDPESGRYLLRFRRDILADPPSKSPVVNEVIGELNNLLDDPEANGWRLPEDVFKENVVLLMDNARFLHMRTEIKDKRRHLRRVRFHGNPQID
ncbi:hypothetical protein F4677DRAFT_451032 [Hypoxylon crocopeplum]|nr:hypothetical protein F4677DRAFT_451032 [Hypoxylon crocopeplum]